MTLTMEKKWLYKTRILFASGWHNSSSILDNNLLGNSTVHPLLLPGDQRKIARSLCVETFTGAPQIAFLISGSHPTRRGMLLTGMFTP